MRFDVASENVIFEQRKGLVDSVKHDLRGAYYD